MTTSKPSTRARTLLLSVLLLASTAPSQVPESATAKTLHALGIHGPLVDLFETVQPELLRYGRLATPGQACAHSEPPREKIDAEVSCFESRLKEGRLPAPDRGDALLCYNLVLHRPEVGGRYLQLLCDSVRPGDDRIVDAALGAALASAGPVGEAIASRGLERPEVAWRRIFAAFLAENAIDPRLGDRLLERFARETDPITRVSLLHALGTLLHRPAAPLLKAAFPLEEDPLIRAGIVFSVVEIDGRAALDWLRKLGAQAEIVQEEIDRSVAFLSRETTEENPHGFVVEDDPEFAAEFGALDSPTMNWMRTRAMTPGPPLSPGDRLDDGARAGLFDVLEESLGFGLEAVKGRLFASLKPADLPRLVRLRTLSSWCPNAGTQGRQRTLMIMIRSLRAGAQ